MTMLSIARPMTIHTLTAGTIIELHHHRSGQVEKDRKLRADASFDRAVVVGKTVVLSSSDQPDFSVVVKLADVTIAEVEREATVGRKPAAASALTEDKYPAGSVKCPKCGGSGKFQGKSYVGTCKVCDGKGCCTPEQAEHHIAHYPNYVTK